MSESVSRKDVLDRVNHELEKKDQVLVECEHLCRSCMALGDYYLMDRAQNMLLDTHVDLAKLAAELGCLADWEQLEVPQGDAPPQPMN